MVKVKPIVPATIIRDNGLAITIQYLKIPLIGAVRIRAPVTLEHSSPTPRQPEK